MPAPPSTPPRSSTTLVPDPPAAHAVGAGPGRYDALKTSTAPSSGADRTRPSPSGSACRIGDVVTRANAGRAPGVLAALATLALAVPLAPEAQAAPSHSKQFLLPGTSTFTVPKGVSSITADLWGAGGGGAAGGGGGGGGHADGYTSGGSGGSGGVGGGGGGGAHTRCTIKVTPGSTLTLSIGRGGTGVEGADGGAPASAQRQPGRKGSDGQHGGDGGTTTLTVPGNGIAATARGGRGGQGGKGGEGGNPGRNTTFGRGKVGRTGADGARGAGGSGGSGECTGVASGTSAPGRNGRGHLGGRPRGAHPSDVGAGGKGGTGGWGGVFAQNKRRHPEKGGVGGGTVWFDRGESGGAKVSW